MSYSIKIRRHHAIYVQWLITCLTLLAACFPALSATKTLTGVPCYNWYYGCFGTAAGNLAGYWDRHGFDQLYTGTVNGGVAPLDTGGANVYIYAMWATKAGVDGRNATNWGHVDNYYKTGLGNTANGGTGQGYQETTDPYKTLGRTPHADECIGDFIGLSQYSWTNMNDECNGNINAWCFNYWDTNGAKRVNFTPPMQNGSPVKDLQSGLRAWWQYRGYNAEVYSQLVDVHPRSPAGTGFTFSNLVEEIDAGFPVLLWLQSTALKDANGNNPGIHGMMAYGYNTASTTVYYRISWATGGIGNHIWNSATFEGVDPLMGVIVVHPQFGLEQTINNQSTTTWWTVGTTAETLSAESWLGEATNPVFFAQWQDAATNRWPAATGAAPAQITGLVMTQQTSVTAVYLSETNDSDADNIPDWYEMRYAGTNDLSPTADTDNDGLTNEQEALAGTDPLDPTSRLTTTPSNTQTLSWPYCPNRQYTILSATNPAGPWTTNAITTTNTWTETNDWSHATYYRIQVAK